MLTVTDRLLLQVHHLQTADERGPVIDALLDAHRPREANLLRMHQRCLVRLNDGHWHVQYGGPMMRTYRGFSHDGTEQNFESVVYVCHGNGDGAYELIEPGPSLALRRHSPSGFSWGYRGSGPAQLALALLLHCCGELLALGYYHYFMTKMVSTWPEASWAIDEEVIWRLVDVEEYAASLPITQLRDDVRQM